jgi:ribosomal protein S18 acetylase RimI-like enzyme
MSVCFEDFGKEGIWLSVHKKNTAAINTYLGFGFRISPKQEAEDKVFMTY